MTSYWKDEPLAKKLGMLWIPSVSVPRRRLIFLANCKAGLQTNGGCQLLLAQWAEGELRQFQAGEKCCGFPAPAFAPGLDGSSKNQSRGQGKAY